MSIQIPYVQLQHFDELLQGVTEVVHKQAIEVLQFHWQVYYEDFQCNFERNHLNLDHFYDKFLNNQLQLNVHIIN